MPLTLKIMKYGTTMVMTIPHEWAEVVGLKAGDEVEVSLEDTSLRVRPKRRRA